MARTKNGKPAGADNDHEKEDGQKFCLAEREDSQEDKWDEIYPKDSKHVKFSNYAQHKTIGCSKKSKKGPVSSRV